MLGDRFVNNSRAQERAYGAPVAQDLCIHAVIQTAIHWVTVRRHAALEQAHEQALRETHTRTHARAGVMTAKTQAMARPSPLPDASARRLLGRTTHGRRACAAVSERRQRR
jgi:hypothetical protein